MRARCVTAFVILVVALQPNLGEAQSLDPNSGNLWLRQCTESFTRPDCVGFVSGVDEFLYRYPTTTPFYCPPRGVTRGQMVDVAVKFMRDNPARLHEPFVSLLIDSLRAAFPCR